MAVEVIYTFYSYVFGLYIFSLTTINFKNDQGCHQKESACVFYYVRIHTSQICTFWTEIQGYHLTRHVLHTLIIFLFLYYVAIVQYLQYVRILESVGIISI